MKKSQDKVNTDNCQECGGKMGKKEGSALYYCLKCEEDRGIVNSANRETKKNQDILPIGCVFAGVKGKTQKLVEIRR